jgi:hypothetical protein
MSPLPMGEGKGEGIHRHHGFALTPTLSRREREKNVESLKMWSPSR